MWYRKVIADISLIPDMVDYYNRELEVAQKEVKISGSIQANIAMLPGQVDFRFCQLQEIEAVLEFLNMQLRKIKQENYKKYLEGYNKLLSSRDAEKYADAEDDVVNFEMIVNQVALLRNKYLANSKSMEQKSYMLGHLTKLKCAGMEDYAV